jgi:hypothetical protein
MHTRIPISASVKLMQYFDCSVYITCYCCTQVRLLTVPVVDLNLPPSQSFTDSASVSTAVGAFMFCVLLLVHCCMLRAHLDILALHFSLIYVSRYTGSRLQIQYQYSERIVVRLMYHTIKLRLHITGAQQRAAIHCLRSRTCFST